jgi:L-rhamnose mutarotase
MERHASAVKLTEGKVKEFHQGIRNSWEKIKQAITDGKAKNFSIWEADHIVLIYFETDEVSKSVDDEVERIFDGFGECFEWLSRPTEEPRLMYHDFGIYREDKSMIRHRVFVTRLKEGFEEEYKARHDALVEARGGVPDPGPDSNFSIWYMGGYIIGYDEIDTSMEADETDEDRQATISWETKMLEIMDWVTDDVDWLTGMHHPHVKRLAYYR